MLSPMEPKPSRDRRIREEFEVVGGSMTTQAFARHCIGAGLWSEDELERFALSHAQSEIRRALKKPDATGLPFAGQTHLLDDGARLWTQRALWVYDDYAINIAELVTQRDAMHWEAVGLAQECRDRFGRAPSIGAPDDDIDATEAA